MPVPPLPRLTMVLETSAGVYVPIASWALPDDETVNVTPGVQGVDDALDYAAVNRAQEGAAIVSMAGQQILTFGADSVDNTTTTRYLGPGYQLGVADDNPPSFENSLAGTIRNLRVRHNRPLGNGQPIVYTLRVNGAPTALTVSVTSTATNGQNLANSVAVNAGDVIDLQVTKAADVATSPGEVLACVQIDF